MTPEQIMALTTAGRATKYDPATSPMEFTIRHSRGPSDSGTLTSLSARLKPIEATSAPAIGSHVTFVIDISGSMGGGENMSSARRVFQTVFDAISDDTQISIILFNHQHRVMKFNVNGTEQSKCRKADVKSQVSSALAAVYPNGGTNIIGALAATASVINPDAAPTREQIDNNSIIFITDGQDGRFFNQHVTLTPGVATATVVAGERLTAERLLTVLKEEMAKTYCSEHFPRIMPIGIGEQYMEQLLTAIGSDTAFHRTGFMHIARTVDVDASQDQLEQTVDPIREKTDLFVTFKDSTNSLLPWTYLQRNNDKKFTCDSSNIDKIYLVQKHDDATPSIIELIPEIPALDSLTYDDDIMKIFLLAENARINTATQAGVDDATRIMLQERIKYLLGFFTKDYWQKYKECLEAISNLERIYKANDDQVKVRHPVRFISTKVTSESFVEEHSHGLSRMASACLSAVASVSATPGGF